MLGTARETGKREQKEDKGWLNRHEGGGING